MSVTDIPNQVPVTKKQTRVIHPSASYIFLTRVGIDVCLAFRTSDHL